MRPSLLVLIAGVIALAAMPVSADPPCSIETPCTVATGSYLLHVPKNWDGHTALPAVMFFHGYRGSAIDEMANFERIRFADDTGTLLIVPNGQNGRWSFPGSPHAGRDEFAFVGAVLDDVEARFPIDRTRTWATGFSIGGSMTWYVACFMGGRFAAFAPIAGSFWEPAPNDCPTGPANIRHIHGLIDRTVPLEGRAIGPASRQSDTWIGLATWRRINGCPSEPTRIDKLATMICRVWTNCASGKELQLCLHPGEHEIWTDWLRADSQWVDALAKAHPLAPNNP
jgi:polyhydroxybutyrate depolymerase